MKGKIPDINSLERGQISSLALMKLVLSGKFLDIRSEKRRKKKLCEYAETLTGLYDKNNAELSELFSSGDFDAIFEFLSACEKNEEEYNRTLFSESLSGAPEDKKRDLGLITSVIYESVFLAVKDDGLRIIVYCNSFLLCYRLTTHDAPEKEVGRIRFSNWRAPVSYDNESGFYCISYFYSDGDEDGERQTNLVFSDFELDIIPVNTLECIPPDFRIYGAYGYLSVAAEYILRKKTLDSDIINERETGLFPLLSELADLIRGERKLQAYPELEKIFYAHNEKRALSRLKKVKGGEKHKRNAVSSLLKLLNAEKYEPIRRDIYTKIYECQKDYPRFDDIVYPKEKYDELKRRADDKMRKLGYEGQYPDYKKSGSIKGVHFVSAQTGGRLVFLADDVSFFIKCFTFFDDCGELVTNVYSGFAVNTKDRRAADIFSCMFYGGSAMTRIDAEKEKALELAVKFAECRKLTSEEKKHVYGRLHVGALIMICLTAGLLWSLLFHFAFIPLFYLAVKLMGDATTFSEYISSIPILPMFLFGWLGFGGLLLLFMLFFKKR